ncbi:MAG: hypothetical protein E7163_05775 [Firmicutes bacterium]|nr:hypothetical protein [Bacillota bacterium]
MKFKEFIDLGIKTDDGVLLTKYLLNVSLAKSDNVKRIIRLFKDNGYDLSIVPGSFFKIFTYNEKEIAELEKVLEEINSLGLKNIFQVNLKVGSFKREFLERLKFCLNNNIPYLNSDNSFIKELYSKELFGEYTAKKPLQELKGTSEVVEEKVNLEPAMDAEDKQVYNEIIEKLNYLVLANPTDEFLAIVKDNIIKKIPESILRKEYKFLPVGEMISAVMFSGLDVTPLDNIRIEELISNEFPTEERNLG